MLLISRNLPPLTGGMERLVANAVNELARTREVAVVGPRGCGAHLPASVRASATPGTGLLSYLPFALLLSLVAGLRQRPGVVLAGSGVTAPLARCVAVWLRIPYAVLVHGLDIIAPSRAYQRVFVPCLRAADAIVANSAHTAALARSAGIDPSRTHVLHPGVCYPPAHRNATGFRAAFGLGQRPVILSVGRIVRRKGLARFIEHALPLIVRELPETVLAIVGEEPAAALMDPGSERRAIEHATRAQGLERNVVLCGRTDDRLLDAAYAESSALVFPVLDIPGDVEGFGMVAIEAAAHGLPTLGFRAGGLPDAVVDGTTGRLLAADDYSALVAALLETLQSGTRERYAEACLRHAEAHSWERYGTQLARILDSISAGRIRG